MTAERVEDEEVTITLKRSDAERLSEILLLFVVDHKPLRRLQEAIFPFRYIRDGES